MAKRDAKLLVVGAGGREHALAWKLAQSDKVSTIFVGGVATKPAGDIKIQPVPDDCPEWKDHAAFVAWCKSTGIDLVVVGPEDPLVAGLVDDLTAAGIAAFGPSKAAAQIEGSKEWAHKFMERHNVPTSRYCSFDNADAACQHIDTVDYPALVVKADGLAAGKGVVVGATKEEAKAAVKSAMDDRVFGNAGATVVIEELLVGPEVSVFALSDGKHIECMLPAQDHKRLLDGDLGPNTGGMGAYVPTPLASPSDLDAIRDQVAQRTVDGFAKDGTPYQGLLYCQVMLTATGPRVVEFNCRFGDPETQPLMTLLTSDLYEQMWACSSGSGLKDHPLTFKPDQFAIAVVLVSGGYPGKYPKGIPITGIDVVQHCDPEISVFYAGAKHDNGKVVTSGGRVLAVCATGSSLDGAVDRVYQAVPTIHFDGVQYRGDIAGQVAKGALTYAAAGVNIEAGDSLVSRIKPVCKATKRSGCSAIIGGFGGVFDLKEVGYTDPLLISGTDGVGTKLEVAKMINKHDTIGIDLVAMCVNDILAHGAEPLFFLDYFATGKLTVEQAADVVIGIAEGCQQSGCALIGGETAEMPGLYKPGDYDVAGFAVGAVERSNMMPREKDIKPGDVIIGIGSSGIHSNGFSLVRKIVAKSGLPYSAPPPYPSQCDTLGESLLTPTKIYVKSLLPLTKKSMVKAFAHITGGGLSDNISRVIPDGLCAAIDVSTWTIPPMFRWLCAVGGVPPFEMSRTYNCGLGGVVVVDANDAKAIMESLSNSGEACFEVGKIVATDGPRKVVLSNLAHGFDNLDSITLPTYKAKKKVGVMISGSGTNLASLIKDTQSTSKASSAEIVVVISNRPGVAGIERARKAGIPAIVVDHKKYSSRQEFEAEVMSELRKYDVELVCLAGFMRVLTDTFVKAWQGRLLNIHPSLLPSFKGVNAQKQALEAHVCVTGCTVHFVDVDVDTGPIILQEAVPVNRNDTLDDLVERIKAKEHQTFPKALELVANGSVFLDDEGKLSWK